VGESAEAMEKEVVVNVDVDINAEWEKPAQDMSVSRLMPDIKETIIWVSLG
jgi:hypothetical protein